MHRRGGDAGVGVVRCFAGYTVRTGLVRALGVPDFAVPIAEDLIAVLGCLGGIARF